MGWFSKDDVTANAGGVTSIIQNVRSAFTGEIPPEVQLELVKLETTAVSERWKADSIMPWWKSSRSIVFLALNFTTIAVILGQIQIEPTMFSSLMTMTGALNVAMVGGKSIEYLKAGRAP